MKKVLDFLQFNKVFHLATLDGDHPRVRPLGFVMIHDEKLFFGVGRQKNVYQQLKANPKVEISSASMEGLWIRITGKAVFDERPEVLQAAFNALPALKDRYGAPDGPGFGTFYMSEAEAHFCDMHGSSKIVIL